MTKEVKPMLNTDGLIKHLQSKGVKFDKMNVEEATTYLRDNNNYFKLCAYRKNFPKHPDGVRKGQYINLDFAYIKDLSIIDMRMRYTFIQMALDIEHFAKVRLMRVIEESGNGGYQIVDDYFNGLKAEVINGTNRYEILKQELNRNRDNPYCGGIIEKYDDCYPIWAFIEIAPLGTMIHFYGFCADQLNDRKLKNEYFLLMTIRELRNAAAHSNCLIYNMGVKDRKYNPDFGMLRALSVISKGKRDSQLENERMRQIITLLYAHTVFVTSKGVHEHAKENLDKLIVRMYRDINYYEFENIFASFEFFKNSVDILFK